MTEDHGKAPPPADQAAPPDEECRAQRHRLAGLLGRLLARYWLRFRAHAPEAPKTPTPEPTQE
jgi:hypothetical protein